MKVGLGSVDESRWGPQHGVTFPHCGLGVSREEGDWELNVALNGHCVAV